MNANDRAITALVTLSHSLVHTYEFALPIFIPVWLAQFDATAFTIGATVTVGLSFFGLGALPSGLLADRRGSQPLLVACLAGMGTAFLMLAAAPNLLVLGLALAVWGLAASAHHPAGLTLVTRGARARGDALAWHGTSGNVGTVVGPLLTTILLVFLDWRLIALLLALPALAAALVASRIDVDETAAVAAVRDGQGRSDADHGRTADFLGRSKLLFASGFAIVFGLVMFYGLYYRGSLTFLPTLFQRFEAIRPVRVLGGTFDPANYIFAGLLAVGMLGQYTGGKLTDRVPVELGLTTGFSGLCLLAPAYLPAAGAGLGPLLALSAAFGFVLFSIQPFYQATVAEYTPAGARGLSYGYTYLGDFGVGALGAWVAGAVLTYTAPFVLFGLLAAFAAVGAGFGGYLLARGRTRGVDRV